MPALLMSTSIRPNRDTAVSVIFAAVLGSAMSPATNARFADAGNGFTVVMFREFATTRYPRCESVDTSPAPIPREAPVTMAIFCDSVICRLRARSDRYRASDETTWTGAHLLHEGIGRHSLGPTDFHADRFCAKAALGTGLPSSRKGSHVQNFRRALRVRA